MQSEHLWFYDNLLDLGLHKSASRANSCKGKFVVLSTQSCIKIVNKKTLSRSFNFLKYLRMLPDLGYFT
jgi:hypothetical protein